MALGLSAVALLPSRALAVPPTLLSAGHQSGVPTATWALPPGYISDRVEVAVTPTTQPPGSAFPGSFFPQDVRETGVVATNQTSWKGFSPLAPGTYYTHVGACPSTAAICFVEREWSNILSFVVPEPPPPPIVDEPIDEEQVEQAKCPKRGRFRGKTSQGYKVCFTLSRNGRRLTSFEFNYRARCDDGSVGEGHFPLPIRATVRKDGRIKSPTALTGRIKGRRARGTVRARIEYRTFDPLTCDSGTIRWSARRG